MELLCGSHQVMQKKAKYSIIIPVHNSLKYLPTCIETIIRQDFHDYELIISDDNSTDGTTEYLRSLSHPNIKVIQPSTRLSMVEHFEWALGHAIGDWCMFVGGDDGLQSYFFELSEKLTTIAEEKNVRLIMSERAYFFWEGCDLLYGKQAVTYNARKSIRILNSHYQSLLALLGFQTYFELPEMYTTSLFRKSVITEAKKKMGGRLLSTIPADANLAAIGLSLEKYYIKSEIPLGWVGTSPNGVIYSMPAFDVSSLPRNISYEDSSGNFALRSCSIYFWNSILKTELLRTEKLNKFLVSDIFKLFIFSGVLSEIRKESKIDGDSRYQFFYELLSLNKINYGMVFFISIFMGLAHKIYGFKNRILNYVFRRVSASYRYQLDWEAENSVNLLNESEFIYREIKKRGLFDSVKLPRTEL
jgi:glycosyltransferase involved in cell wall biosynthesis